MNRSVFKRLLEYNDSVLRNIFNSYAYANWYNLKLDYDLSRIEQLEVFDNALAHIEERIPSFRIQVTEIQSKTQELNQTVEKTMDTIKSKVVNTLGQFDITFEDGSPVILHKLQLYWFGMLHSYRSEKKWYRNIIAELRPFNDELKEEGNYLRLGTYGVANLPIDKDKNQFVSSVMALVKDDEIWFALLDLVRTREEIGDKIRTITRPLYELVNEVNNEKYRVVLNCCPSQRVKTG